MLSPGFGRHQFGFRFQMSLIGGELEEARGLSRVFREAATSVLVKEPQLELAVSVSIIRGEFEQSRRLGRISRLSAPATCVKDAKVNLRLRVALVGGELKKLRRLAVVLWQPSAPA